MARPRTITDERILDALAQVIDRKGPEFTIADVAAEAGVSVGAVAKRFGSKSGLLQALTKQGTEDVVRRMRAAGNVRDALLTWFDRLADPEVATNNLAQLGVDLIDPELRALLAKHYAALEDELFVMCRREDLPPNAARVLSALVYGISMDWSVRPRGDLMERMTEDLDSVLEGWR
ncbi:TetR/AcrR family transcriptional regulator [Lentzea sp. NBRC 105346]|uniref:TetR/AcrR family transcriptional regulator n=1 Tax=Lentzea sp. NBRC 105346 TaxID=3032205 RepID=UPI002555237F|nr:TetR/AcrR family transcriptional regulator [Lentzea sp. NBRC 105346]